MSIDQGREGPLVKFTSPVTYPVESVHAVTSGDFNGDGKMDLIAGGQLLLGSGDGKLTPATHFAADPQYIIAKDFNRDGKLDLALVPDVNNLRILFGNGDGSFQPAVNYPVGAAQILAADFNNDGWLDLAGLGGTTGNGINVLLGSSNGTFHAPATYSFGSGYSSTLAAGDFNGDGKVDLIVAPTFTETVRVLLGNGDGTFQTPISSSTKFGEHNPGPNAITVGDFDGDGKLDVAIGHSFLKILKGNGDGTFVPIASYRLNNTSVDLKVADFNGDGRLDLVSAGIFTPAALQVLLGNGDGTFQDAGSLIPDNGCLSVVVTDLNGDTKPDLAAKLTLGQLVVLLNITPGNLNNTDFFIHQHYVDFLNREPDALGFNFWTNQINSCGADQQCIELNRNNVSAAFFLSIEFQQTAYLVERLYKTAYGDAVGASTFGGAHQFSVPIVRFNEHLMDTRQIGQDVIVGQRGWDTLLENNKQNFIAQFVQRPRFTTALPTTLTPAQFVDGLNQNAGYLLSPNERATAIALFGNATDTSDTTARAQALRQIAENQNLYNAEFNRAFVLMEYFGYLRRNPNDGPDSDFSGYDFWLNKLNAFNRDYQKAEMVKAFITANEYRKRFGP